MEFLTSSTLIIVLIAVIATLVAVIIYLNIIFYREKRLFRIRIDMLQRIISEISGSQNKQLGAIQLSEEINHRLQSAKATLSNDIFSLNYEMFEILSKNNLLKK